FGAVILTHIFLDAFNNYGVAWFEPFSHYRISFNMVYVADPFFSIGPFISLAMLVILRQRDKAREWNKKRRFWLRFGLILSFCYLGYAAFNKFIVDHDVKQQLARQDIKYNRYFTTPAPLQNWLWYVVAGNDTGYYVGYRSVFDNNKKMALHYFPRNKQLLDTAKCKKEVQQLIRFSQQFYTAEKNKDTLIFNDLRFGQIIGWQDPKEGFAFHYYLKPEIDNTLVVQRGRFAKWDGKVMRTLLNRMIGN
ncbi:MAG TPA: metal-dependent hydrolase, partial [Ferruginibacter sp.]|nr:metal-dependent hydrolase [Ferruginibacter sp.]